MRKNLWCETGCGKGNLRSRCQLASCVRGRGLPGGLEVVCLGSLVCLGLCSPPTVAQCLSSKGFYPTACALFVIRGLLVPGDVLFGGFLRLNWQAVLMSVLHLVHTASVHAESGDPRVEKSMQFKKYYWCDYNFNL